MCDPVTLSVAAIGTAAASGGLQAYGAAKSASGQKAAYTLQSMDAAKNAQIANLQGQAILDMADVNIMSTAGTAAINSVFAQQMARIQGEGIMSLAGINATNTEKVGELNATAAETVSGINADLKTAIGDFNMQVADGNYNMLMGVADLNAKLAEQDAVGALDQGRQEGEASYLKYGQLRGAQTAQLAANGVALDSDSAVRLVTSTDWSRDVDATTIAVNAQRAAWGYRAQGAIDMAESQIKGLAIKADAMGAKIGMDADAARERMDGQFSALQTRSSASWDAFTQRQNAAFTAFSAQQDADTYAFQTLSQARTDILNIKTTSQMQALDTRIQAGNYTNASTAAAATAKSISPTLAATTSLMGTAAQVAGMWYSASSAGTFGKSGYSPAAYSGKANSGYNSYSGVRLG